MKSPKYSQVCQKIIDQAEGKHQELYAGISREAFYERARNAYAVVITGEARTYGCILIKKGVVFPPNAD